jgi:hypothetical protein
MIGHLLFSAKASFLRLKRLADDRPPPRKEPTAEDGTFDQLLSEVRAPLRDATDANSRLTVGKIENLRRAVLAVHGIELNAGERFSFWSQVGRPTRRRGFVEGREIREGCVVPSVGGGLCQLSNALYGAALDGSVPILERHAHSRAITRSAVVGRDATVFWNYIDFRFQTTFPLRISATLSADDLIVQFWVRRQSNTRLALFHESAQRVLRSAVSPGGDNRIDSALDVRDCTTCNRSDCRDAGTCSGKYVNIPRAYAGYDGGNLAVIGGVTQAGVTYKNAQFVANAGDRMCVAAWVRASPEADPDAGPIHGEVHDQCQ